jgi:SsrA-binding protein
MKKEPRKMIAENRKARYNYFIVDTYEAGMVLTGTEVKSLRQGRANLTDAYAKIENDEVFAHQLRISPYPFAYYGNHEPLRVRKLLLHKQEIKRLTGKTREKGFSLIPLNLYFRNGRAKMTLALAKGKAAYDKRETIRQRDEKRDLARARRHYQVS